MNATLEAFVPARRACAGLAAVSLVLFSLTAAWIVLADAVDPPPLELELTADGTGLVVRGGIDSHEHRDALLDTLGDITDAAIILNATEIDPDVELRDSIEQTARRLVRSIGDD